MYRQLLGTRSTFRMQRWILPELAWNQETYGRRVLTTLKPRTRWLDLGCGQRLLCNGLENVEKELSSHRFVGVDLSLDNLRSQRHTKYRVLADGNRLPFKSESFDLITANMVVEHFQLPDLAFQEINRVLAPGGVVLMHTPNLANYLVFANRVISKVIPRRLHAAFVGTSEKRTEDEIYPAFYRANTEGRMRKVGSPVGNVSVEFLPAPRPFFHYFAPIALGELLLTRMLQARPFRRFLTTLLVTIEKPDRAWSIDPDLVASSREPIGGAGNAA
jgi:SAM-dependent methyltransferase